MENKKRAFITGITGQDGSYLAEMLLEKGYEVFGLVRRNSSFEGWWRIENIKDKITTYYGDMTDPFSLLWALKKCQPDEVYNLAAQSHVGISWELPYYTAQTVGVGTLNLLEAINVLGLECKVYQASTSELFSGRPGEAPQDESTVMDPQSPYGTAKLFAYQITKNYRDAFGMFICNGILFNHESPRRGDNFVTKKIVNASKHKRRTVELGNMEAKRDWGYAPEYMEAAWRMLQRDKPDDYIIATGESHSVREFVNWVTDITGKPMIVIIKDKYIRPQDVADLRGDPKKAEILLNWKAETKGKGVAQKML